ncbi:GAF and ANTAR domain-containing protein [Nocardioides nanhaiensis]|uniref:ANTAR domain-containing protein n=1 Tax=Nocardioides nanhaiensis TaxID=1476871 RepID=A0ABP8VU82_9ACTN
MHLHDAIAALARSATALSGTPGEVASPQRVCEVAVELIEDCDDASVTVRGRGGRAETLAATSTLAEQLDLLQYSSKQGPCLEAATEAGLLRSRDLHQESRWPRWTPAAARQGVGSLVCVQLLAGNDLHGAVNLYGRREGGFDDEAMDLAMLYTTHATLALNAARVTSGLATAMHTRHHIGVAQGILMARHGLDLQQAFAVLQRYSSEQNIKLARVAEQVIDDVVADPGGMAAGAQPGSTEPGSAGAEAGADPTSV